VTSPFDSSTPLLYKWSVDIFVYLFPFKSYSRFSFWLEIAIGAEILGVLGILDPLMHAHINETPKTGTYLRQTASFEASCMLVRRSVRPVRDCEKNIFKISFFKYQKKKSQSRYISRMRGGALSNRLQWKFAHLLRSPT
jgi:hypothetical protein